MEIETHPPEEYFPGKVLNKTLAKLNEPLIIFLNSDAVPLSPLTLEHLIAPFDHPDVVGTYGRQLPRPDASPWVMRDYEASYPFDKAAPWIPFSLCLAAIRRSAWEAHPFYETAWASEDAEWGLWALQQGHSITYVKDALVMHSHNYTLSQIYGRRFAEGEADACIYGKEYPFWKSLWDTAKGSLRDFPYYVHWNQYLSIPTIPLRRWIYFWAYYQGHQHGRKRLAGKSDDPSLGQKIALSRHPSHRR